MKAEDCKIGADLYTEDGINYRYRVLALPDEQGIVRVEPTEKSSGEMNSFHLDELYLYDPVLLQEVAANIQAKIDSAKNAFEKAFEELSSLKREDGRYLGNGLSIHDLETAGLISLQDLEKTIDDGGWSTSSLWC